MQNIFKKYILLLRPHQWLKNLLLLFPPFFGGKVLDAAVLAALLPSLLSFSFAASCGYIMNDIKDRELDSHHATKKNRPIARGEISLVVASIIAAVLYLAAMVIAGSVSARFEGYLIVYLFISFFYTMYFKDMVIIDILFISFGFLVRVLAGGEAFHTFVTMWLILTVLTVALFLAAGKRLGELLLLRDGAQRHRLSLTHYSTSFLRCLLWVAATFALVTYLLYIIENRHEMIYTIPLAAFGLFRYITLTKQGHGDPTEALLKDARILATCVIWAGMTGFIIYK